MVVVKQASHKTDAENLWNDKVEPITYQQYVEQTADTEKLLLFSESGGGKTTFYLEILNYLLKQGFTLDQIKMCIVFPDRPSGLVKLHGLIPKEFLPRIDIFPVNNYEETVKATASAHQILVDHYKQHKVPGWSVFELMENYWSFAQDYYSRQAFGKSLGEYFAQMQTILQKSKADKKTAYEAFAGPFGGPWPIIKFFHNFNWMDRIKRFPYHVVFTSEIKQEDNDDSVFKSLGYRPAGEKHNQHRVDTILYLSHKGNNFYMRPYKLTGYQKLYPREDITGKNGYEEHRNQLLELEKEGHCVSKIKHLEDTVGITPPKKPEKPKEQPVKEKKEEPKPKPKEEKKPEKKEESEDNMWEL